jgi:6,7-dimethyl-8-ribityllumazine synthase
MKIDARRAPSPSLPGGRILIVAARYYPEIVDAMTARALEVVAEAGATGSFVEAPGAFEIPGVIAMAASLGEHDGFIGLGCVVRGETSHYDYVCGESARGLMELSIRDKLAIGYGVLTVETLAQAKVRADAAQGDKGGEAARACLAMAVLRRRYVTEPLAAARA